jgi:hypothetical protein
MVLDALEMARWDRGTPLDGLVCHSDTGSQGGFTSIRYCERLAEICAAPSIGSVGDSYGNALAEPVHNLCKGELVKAREPCKTIDDLELATLGWVAWCNRERLHGTINDVPPGEHEAAFYAAASRPTNRRESNTPDSPSRPVRLRTWSQSSTVPAESETCVRTEGARGARTPPSDPLSQPVT